MGIDVKDVCVMLWKVLRISTKSSFRYVRRYPVASGVSAFIILLYTFLPRLFYFLLCSSPLLACASFYLRNHLSMKIGGSSLKEGGKGDNGFSSVSREVRIEKAELKHQRSVRRNARRKVEEVGKDWDSSQASEDERGKVILTTLYGELLPETITPDLEKFKRDRTFLVGQETTFLGGQETTFLGGQETSFDYDLDNKGDNNVVVVDPLESVDAETEADCSSSSSSSSEEEEEEERRDDRKKVIVPWTEEDQKNLMDLGTSEMERNKRLENLISRRRSRRLFLLAAERSLMDMEVPRICIGRNYYGLDKENYEIDGLLMPGSAPSILLPRRNPFDLPYDPHEEKPNLSGDSFHQEFAEPNNPKDIFLCRHESFHHRNLHSEILKDSKLTSSWRTDVDDKPRALQDNNDQLPLVEERDLTGGKGNGMEAGEVLTERDSSIRNDDSDSNSSTLSPQERDRAFNASSDQSDASETFTKRNSLAGLVPRSGGSSSLASARQMYMEHFGYSTRKCHMVTHSVDSDLQVEVSELGSPPTSVDGNDYSDEERSLFVYESDTGKEMVVNDQDLNEKISLASPDNKEAKKMVPQPANEVINKTKQVEELKKPEENSADEIKISYDSDEAGPSEKTDQESVGPSERNDEEEMQQLVEAEAETLNVNYNGNSQESAATSPRSVLQLQQTHSEDLEHISDGQVHNAESSHNQLDEHTAPPEETIVGAVSSDTTVQEEQEGSDEATFNGEFKSLEENLLPIAPLAQVVTNNHTDGDR